MNILNFFFKMFTLLLILHSTYSPLKYFCLVKQHLVLLSESVGCSVMSDSAAPWTVAHQAPLPMEFSRQEYWNG